MSLRDWAITKLGGTPPQTHVMQAGRAGVSMRGMNRPLAPGCRVGMWVRWNDRTAIVQGATDDGLIELHIVNNAGETVLVTHQPWESMRRAMIGEIPPSRLPLNALDKLDMDRLQRLGYKE